MSWFSKNKPKLFNPKEAQAQRFMYRVIPQMAGEWISRYFRVQVEGEAYLKETPGPLVICPNHSGFSGLDAFVLSHQIEKITGKRPCTLTHKLWFAMKPVGKTMKELGFVKASKKEGLSALDRKESIVIFPEGEYGNFKPSLKAYHLQRFRKGFVRMALAKQCPIVPCLIIGAEESHINLARLQPKWLGKSPVPLPLNLIPLPTKWYILFLEPIELPYQPEVANENEWVQEISTNIREQMQRRLSIEVSQRKNLYF